jgi:type IV pilus assembly protein PilB
MSDGRDRPDYLQPVPPPGTENVATAADTTKAEAETGTPGLTPPHSRGRSGGFITDVIVELGYASPENAERMITEARTAGKPPERLMLRDGLIDGDQLSRAIAERYGLDHVDLAVFHIDMAAANLISIEAARRYRAVPISFIDKQTLLVAMADPANVLALDDIQMGTGHNCRVAVSSEEDVDALVARLNTLQSAVSEAIQEDADEAETELADVSELRESADDAPVIKLVYSILGQAVSEGASDIHFELGEGEMRVRFRVDGVLHEAASVPKRMISGVISLLKIMSDLDIAEKRVPQDGRVGLTVEDKRVDLRITTLPTTRGEGCAVRILDKSMALLELGKLGLTGEALDRFSIAFHKPYGAVVVTGPTGSGKSTTLYAALNEINEMARNIITIEDPVEYRIPGINQMNVNRKAGLSFATGLRSILRADPDVIMVGEVRDAETARIAIESALTGHMVLTTLHTNDAPGAIARLTEMEIETFLTASAVDCVVAQRLARTLCTHCKRRTVVPASALAAAGFHVVVDTDLEAYEPTGCSRCGQTGYKGRVGLFEVMVMSDEIKDMTIKRAAENDIGKVAREQGMRTLREDGLDKVRAGVTSVEEIARVSS